MGHNHLQRIKRLSMSSFNVPFTARAAVSWRALWKILSQPKYVLVSAIIASLMLGILVWVTNLALLISFWLDSAHTLVTKVKFFLYGYMSLFSNYSLLGAGMLLLFSVLTGVNIAILVFVVSRSYQKVLSGGTKNVGAILAAIIGAGCAACGTSFIAPLLATGVSASLSITFTSIVGVVANILGMLLLLYSIFSLGITAATALAQDRLSHGR